jgi:hypothetical protein
VTAEIDVSDLEYEMYYKDQRCQELETILRSVPKYAECQVKRIHWTKDGKDPFDILDEKEESIVHLETWEANTLSASEILVYIEVKQKQDRPLSDRDASLYGASIALGLTTVVFAYVIVLEGFFMSLAFMIVPVFILTPILGFFSIRTYRESITQKKNADLEAARREPSFLSMLQRIAQVPEAPEYCKKRLMKRIKDIENA